MVNDSFDIDLLLTMRDKFGTSVFKIKLEEKSDIKMNRCGKRFEKTRNKIRA